MLFEAGTRTRISRSGWRKGTIGRGVTGQRIMATDRMRRLRAWPLVVCAVLVGACAAEPPAARPSSGLAMVAAGETERRQMCDQPRRASHRAIAGFMVRRRDRAQRLADEVRCDELPAARQN